MDRWRVAMRLVEGIPVDRARLRFTVQYAITPRLAVGVEANPNDDDYGLIANWVAWTEDEWRPALIVGTSSDRIGTPDGRAYYATFSKSLRRETGLPIAPYLGTAFGEFEDDWELIGGLRISWTDRLSTTSMWDGENLHHTLDYAFDEWRAGLVLVQQDDDHYAGITLGTTF